VRLIWASTLTFFATLASAQDKLTLEEALNLAHDRNGTLRAAREDLIAANARAKQQLALFFPTVTPRLTYRDSRQEYFTGLPGTIVQSGLSTQVQADWNIIDSGERGLAYSSSLASERAQRYQTIRTVRSVLFDVVTQYFEVLRTEELLKVQTAQVERAQEFVKQVTRQIEVGDAAKKDVYQPAADEANARVNKLTAETRNIRSQTDLKATIGLEPETKLPELQAYERPTEFPAPPPLEELVEYGLQNRPDLRAQRELLKAQEYQLRRTKLAAGVTWNLNVQYTKHFGPDNINDRLLTFGASIPLFDGGRTREAIREGNASMEASKQQLVQTEREARAEIEAAYRELSLNAQRVEAAAAALEAARVNYESVEKAYNLRVATVVERSTANVTLVTAETNYVEAIFDYAIAESRLKLVTGQRLPGEQPL
jgi:outer membrane protein